MFQERYSSCNCTAFLSNRVLIWILGSYWCMIPSSHFTQSFTHGEKGVCTETIKTVMVQRDYLTFSYFKGTERKYAIYCELAQIRQIEASFSVCLYCLNLISKAHTQEEREKKPITETQGFPWTRSFAHCLSSRGWLFLTNEIRKCAYITHFAFWAIGSFPSLFAVKIFHNEINFQTLNQVNVLTWSILFPNHTCFKRKKITFFLF